MSTPTPRTDTEITFTGAYTCTHHNDQMRAACPVCLVTALTSERDQLAALFPHLCAWWMQRYDAAARQLCENAARAEKAEANLAAERARLDWVFRNCKVTADDYTTGNRDVYAIHDREDLGAAMKEDAK